MIHAVRRLLGAIPLVWAVLTLSFFLVELAPGSATDALVDPSMSPETVAVIRARWGLDRPPLERYALELKAMASGDLGTSLAVHRPVAALIGETLPNTLQLAGVTFLVAQLVGFGVGSAQALRPRSMPDVVLGVVTLALSAVPAFVLAGLLQLLFCLHWPLLPSSGMTDPVMYDYLGGWAQLQDRAAHLVLPGVAMGVAGAAGEARVLRAALIEALEQDHIRTARAKGLPEWAVVGRHALRSAMLPILALWGMSLPAFFSGSVVVEYAFGWPGMGRLIVTAIQSQDTPVILGCFLVYTLLVVVGNLGADLACALLDPRIRLDG